MADDRQDKDEIHPKVKTEYPPKDVADRRTEGGEDRPGADLGGASDDGRQGPTNTIPGGPRDDPAIGQSGDTHGEKAGQSSGSPAGTGQRTARRP